MNGCNIRNQIKFIHFSVNGGKVTAAFRVLGERNEKTRDIEFAFSYCSPKDRFVRATGRELAIKRLNSDETVKKIQLDFVYPTEQPEALPIYKQVIQAIEPHIKNGLDKKVKWVS